MRLCGTTVAVATVPPDEWELERLLSQLLRMVGPLPADRPADDAAAGALARLARAGAATTFPGQRQSSAERGAVNGTDAGQPGAAAEGSPRAAAGGTGGSGTGTELPALSGSEARALIELVSARGIAQGELAGLLGLEKSTVSRLAAGLERKGWIQRGRDEGNQRYVRLYLTAEGAAVAARVWQAWQSRQARILAALSEEERAGLSAGLRGLVRSLAAEGVPGDPAPGA